MSYALRKRLDSGLAYLALCLYLLLAVFPLYWMVMATLKDDYDLVDPEVSPFWVNRRMAFNHFTYLFEQTNFLIWLENTFLIAACVVLITLAVRVPGAYALARLRFLGAENLGIGIFLTYLVPPILLFLPLAQVVSYQ